VVRRKGILSGGSLNNVVVFVQGNMPRRGAGLTVARTRLHVTPIGLFFRNKVVILMSVEDHCCG